MNNKEYKHYSDFPMSEWRWPSFTPRELRSKGDNKLMINYDAMDKLQALRNRLGIPLHVRSAYRTPYHNKNVGGAKRSKHLLAHAFDIDMVNHNTVLFRAAARAVGFTGFGYYPKSTPPFIHIDIGRKRFWGTFWDNERTVKQVAVAPEPVEKMEDPVAHEPVSLLVRILEVILRLIK